VGELETTDWYGFFSRICADGWRCYGMAVRFLFA